MPPTPRPSRTIADDRRADGRRPVGGARSVAARCRRDLSSLCLAPGRTPATLRAGSRDREAAQTDTDPRGNAAGGDRLESRWRPRPFAASTRAATPDPIRARSRFGGIICCKDGGPPPRLADPSDPVASRCPHPGACPPRIAGRPRSLWHRRAGRHEPGARAFAAIAGYRTLGRNRRVVDGPDQNLKAVPI